MKNTPKTTKTHAEAAKLAVERAIDAIDEVKDDLDTVTLATEASAAHHYVRSLRGTIKRLAHRLCVISDELQHGPAYEDDEKRVAS